MGHINSSYFYKGEIIKKITRSDGYLVMGVLVGGGEGQNAGRSSRDAIN